MRQIIKISKLIDFVKAFQDGEIGSNFFFLEDVDFYKQGKMTEIPVYMVRELVDDDVKIVCINNSEISIWKTFDEEMQLQIIVLP